MTIKPDITAAGTDDERRRFVRVQDAVGLHVQRLTDMPAAGQARSEPVINTVRKADKYEIEGYADVRRDYPAVAHYIGELEERIRELLLDSEAAAVKPTHKVSLSAGGIFFTDKMLLHPGEMVGISLTLFPSGQRVGSDARIISANDAPEIAQDDELNYRANFERMSDADRDVLHDHVTRLLGKRPSSQD